MFRAIFFFNWPKAVFSRRPVFQEKMADDGKQQRTSKVDEFFFYRKKKNDPSIKAFSIYVIRGFFFMYKNAR